MNHFKKQNMTKENFLLEINHIIDSGHNDIRFGELFDKIINVPTESAKEFASNPKNIVRSIQGFSETPYEACIRIFKAGWGAALLRPTKNLKLHEQIDFNELIEHGFKNGANVVNGMPWSWQINSKAVTHENDDCYIIETVDGIKKFYRDNFLIAFENGLKILINHNY